MVGASAATVGSRKTHGCGSRHCVGTIDQTLSLNATLEAAVKLRQEVLALRKRRERLRDVDRHVRAALVRAQASFEEEDFEAAIEHCDNALRCSANLPGLVAVQGCRRERPSASATGTQAPRAQIVKEAREEFAAGRQERALARLEQLSPPHDLIAGALEELRKDLESSTQARVQKEREAEAEKRRREAAIDQMRPMAIGPKPEPEQRQLKLNTEKGRIELTQNAKLEAAAEEQRQAKARELKRKAAAEAQVAAEPRRTRVRRKTSNANGGDRSSSHATNGTANDNRRLPTRRSSASAHRATNAVHR